MKLRTPRQCMRELREERGRVKWQAVLECHMGPRLAATLAALLAADWAPPRFRWEKPTNKGEQK